MSTKLVGATALLVLALPAAAQERQPVVEELVPEVTLHDFTDPVEVQGQLVRPLGAEVTDRSSRPGFAPMLRMRGSFLDEAAASLDEVR